MMFMEALADLGPGHDECVGVADVRGELEDVKPFATEHIQRAFTNLNWLSSRRDELQTLRNLLSSTMNLLLRVMVNLDCWR